MIIFIVLGSMLVIGVSLYLMWAFAVIWAALREKRKDRAAKTHALAESAHREKMKAVNLGL